MQEWEACHAVTLAHPKSISLGSQFPNLHYFLPLLSFICVLLQFFYHSRHGKNLKYIHTWFWLPSSITCVQWNKKPKPQDECTVVGVGDGRQDRDQVENTDVQISSETSTHLPNLERKAALCYSSDPSPITLIPGPPKQGGPQQWVLEIQKHSPGTVWIWWKTWWDKPTLTVSTVEFMLQKN